MPWLISLVLDQRFNGRTRQKQAQLLWKSEKDRTRMGRESTINLACALGLSGTLSHTITQAQYTMHACTLSDLSPHCTYRDHLLPAEAFSLTLIEQEINSFHQQYEKPTFPNPHTSYHKHTLNTAKPYLQPLSCSLLQMNSYSSCTISCKH